MEGGQRSSTALPVLLVALLLATSSTTAAAAAQRRHPPTDQGSYKLITLGDQAKLAMRADTSIASFANNKNDWFAIQGSEGLLQPYRDRYGGGGDILGHGLLTSLGGLLKKK